MTKEQIKEFCDYLMEQVNNHSIYVWGGQGELLYETPLETLAKMETSKTNFRRVCDLVNRSIQRGIDISLARLFDCSGLGTYKLIQMGLLKYDTTADGLYKKCTKKALANIKKGDFVFKVDSNGKATHIGYVVNDNKAIVEAYGRDKGVIMATLGKGSNFTKAGTFNG